MKVLQMSDGDRALSERFERRLRQELEELEQLIENSAESSAPVLLDQQSVGRLARVDAMQMQAMAKANERRRNMQRLRLLRTLQRIAEGEFGYCTECGDEIGEGRLGVDPTFHLCLSCAGATR